MAHEVLLLGATSLRRLILEPIGIPFFGSAFGATIHEKVVVSARNTRVEQIFFNFFFLKIDSPRQG